MSGTCIKKTLTEVPVNGGLILLLFTIFSLSVLTLFYGKVITPINYTIIVVVVLFALYGMLDDMVNIGRPAKLILLYYCAYPLIPFITTTLLVSPLFRRGGSLYHLPPDHHSRPTFRSLPTSSTCTRDSTGLHPGFP